MNYYLVIGLIITLLYTEIVGLSPGGMIVPIYFAMNLYSPTKILNTLFISLLVYVSLYLLDKVMILYGRRKFAVAIMLGILIKVFLHYISNSSFIPLLDLSTSIGYIIPGLIARDIERQGFIKTLSSLAIVTILVRIAHDLILSGGLL